MYQTGRLNPRMRAFVVAEADRLGVARAARNIGVSRTTVYRWRRRAGELADRSSRPHRSPRRTSPEREAALLAARLRSVDNWIAKRGAQLHVQHERWGTDDLKGRDKRDI